MQRWLTFDDPQSRLAQLRKLVSRQIIQPKANSNFLAGLMQEKQNKLFTRVFGATNSLHQRKCGLLNKFIALEEFRRFKQLTFDAAVLDLNADGTRAHASQHRNDVFQEQLSLSQKQWLNHVDSIAPDWTKLNRQGPWSKDMRAKFLSDCLQEIGIGNVSDIDAYNCFKAKLNKWRSQLPGEFLPNVILLVEGHTEALLLPHFARGLNVNFDSLAVSLMVAGGANQVVRKYMQLKELISIPIVCVLDADVNTQAAMLKEHLRDNDRLHILESGEIEDVYDASTLVELLNNYLDVIRSGRAAVRPVSIQDIRKTVPRKIILNSIWKERDLGEFDKVGFAKSIVQNDSIRVPSEGRRMVDIVLEALNFSYAS
jgi:hypothetical protein